MSIQETLQVRPYSPPPVEKVQLPVPPWSLNDFDLEMGSGAGLHSLTYCLAHPERNLVSIERTSEKFKKLARRIEKYGDLPNLFALRADAQWWVTKNVAVGSLRNVFILYPNPYPKTSQANQRWARSPFMGRLLQCLRPGGRLVIATNLLAYHSEAVDYLSRYWKLEVRHRSLPTDFQGRTHFEKKYLAAGQTCFETTAIKPENWLSPEGHPISVSP